MPRCCRPGRRRPRHHEAAAGERRHGGKALIAGGGRVDAELAAQRGAVRRVALAIDAEPLPSWPRRPRHHEAAAGERRHGGMRCPPVVKVLTCTSLPVGMGVRSMVVSNFLYFRLAHRVSPSMTRTGRRRRRLGRSSVLNATRLCCLVRRFFPSCWRRLRVVEEAAGRGLVESRQNVALCNHRAESRTDGR